VMGRASACQHASCDGGPHAVTSTHSSPTAARPAIRQAAILAAARSRAYRLSCRGSTVFGSSITGRSSIHEHDAHRLGAEPTAHARTVAIDLRDDLPASLKARGFDPPSPSAWIAEACSAHLPPTRRTGCSTPSTALSPRQQAGHREPSRNPYVPTSSGEAKMRESSAKCATTASKLDLSELGFEG